MLTLMFLVVRVAIYFILSPELGANYNSGFKFRFIGDALLYFSEIFLAAFIMHLSLETLKNQHQQNTRASFKRSNVMSSFIKE
jgi:hypothetical protein